jgi:hypothetical protein
VDGVEEGLGCGEEGLDVLGFGSGMECAVVKVEAVEYIDSINIRGVDAVTGGVRYRFGSRERGGSNANWSYN